MKKIEKEFKIFTEITDLKGKAVIDIGCGTGELVRALTRQGAEVTGIDKPDMLAKAKEHQRAGNEKYLPGEGEHIPVKENEADMVIFFASFHHIPESLMMQALEETYRVLKTGGTAIFLEPVGKEGSYFELIRLAEDEREIQKRAFEAIKNASRIGFKSKKEEIFYMERSYDDFVNMLNLFVDDDEKREEYLTRGKEITARFARDAGVSFTDYRFKSICRMNVLQKSVSQRLKTLNPPNR